MTEREGKPGVSLPPGRYQITGRWRWERLPETLYVPPDTALVSLIVDETAVSWPDIRPDGQLWLKQQAGWRVAMLVMHFGRPVPEMHA